MMPIRTLATTADVGYDVSETQITVMATTPTTTGFSCTLAISSLVQQVGASGVEWVAPQISHTFAQRELVPSQLDNGRLCAPYTLQLRIRTRFTALPRIFAWTVTA